MPRSPTASRSRSPVKRRRSTAGEEAENVCPFLIRLFVTKGRHTPMQEFEEGRFPLQDEFTAYGWTTSTPSSLVQLLLPSFPPLYRSPYARYSFRHIYVDASSRGLYRTKELASFTGRDLMDTLSGPSEAKAEKNGEREKRNGMDMELDDGPREKQGGGRKINEKTLEGYGFVTGDLLSVALHIPEPRNALRRPTAGGAGAGPAPGAGGPAGPGAGRGSFGWPGANGGPGAGMGAGAGAGPGGAGAADRTGAWERGAPLPDQSSARPGEGRNGHGGPASGPIDGSAPGGRWGRGGAQTGAPRGGAGFGGRGQGRRSRSPDYTAGARKDGPEETSGRGRSRSPDRRASRGGRS